MLSALFHDPFLLRGPTLDVVVGELMSRVELVAHLLNGAPRVVFEHVPHIVAVRT